MTARDFLLFRLAGPMAAFGKISVGEQRDIWAEPSKSAVLGLIAGAMGIRRDQGDAHAALEGGLGFAARIDDPGVPLRDFHTTQAPKARKGAKWRIRREELADDDLYTVVSERTYRLETRATIAVWARTGAAPDLNSLASALRRPCFTPYLGRKSCPLGEPPFPQVVAAGGLVAAFKAYDALRPAIAKAGRTPATPIWFEMDAGLTEEDALADLTRHRRDAPRDRELRQFTDRREGRLTSGESDLLEGIVT
jgi:CRISPR system Cascade subunit CasD